MPDAVDALIPLSLLEAVRDVDRPIEDFEAELVGELRNKRLGLSDTVYMQVRRFQESARRGHAATSEETIGIARLLGRRPDAEAVFRAAGRRTAGALYGSVGVVARQAMRWLPGFVSRPMALARSRRLLRRHFGASVARVGAHLYLEVPQSVTVNAAPRSVGCTYYEATLKELLRLLVNSVGAVDHVRCATRGEGTCAWRADWKPSTIARD